MSSSSSAQPDPKFLKDPEGYKADASRSKDSGSYRQALDLSSSEDEANSEDQYLDSSDEDGESSDRMGAQVIHCKDGEAPLAVTPTLSLSPPHSSSKRSKGGAHRSHKALSSSSPSPRRRRPASAAAPQRRKARSGERSSRNQVRSRKPERRAVSRSPGRSGGGGRSFSISLKWWQWVLVVGIAVLIALMMPGRRAPVPSGGEPAAGSEEAPAEWSLSGLGAWLSQAIGYGDAEPEAPQFDLIALTPGKRMSNRCLKMSREDWEVRTRERHWRDVRLSMQHYLFNESLRSITSFDVGQPLCAMTIRTDENRALCMLNPTVVAYRSDGLVSKPEHNIACSDIDVYVERSNRLVVRYFDADTVEPMVAVLLDNEAIAFQQGWAYLNGMSVCERNDDGVNSIYRSFYQGDMEMRPQHRKSSAAHRGSNAPNNARI